MSTLSPAEWSTVSRIGSILLFLYVISIVLSVRRGPRK